ncbi:DNA-J related domain-containing protein [Ectopseudomonas mendocina]|uniref:DNA-J related domain-containing protein n=1 Tax=Ectopseudomonas mendocina TaxID=300 RepID=A0ABZ2RMT3_ECTME
MNDSPNCQSALCDELYEHLNSAPEGLSEYRLIQLIKAGKRNNLPDLPLSDSVGLFRTHFILFNGLYHLRDLLWSKQLATLSISSLCIQLLPYQSGVNGLSENDPLRTYYMDLSQLDSTGADEVEHLLRSFWLRLHNNEDVKAALELFELSPGNEPISLGTIKARYRRLVSQHHPDRGGSTARLQAINKAMEILERHYRSS